MRNALLSLDGYSMFETKKCQNVQDQRANPRTASGFVYFDAVFLVGYIEERIWWPVQSPNKGRKKKANS